MANLGIIYYTDNRLGSKYNHIFLLAQKFITESGLPIVSCSLKPIEFGKNIVLKGMTPCYLTMATQILTALEASETDYVFFCEHDVLYHKSHFSFFPLRDDIYYYNVNNWRWLYPKDYLVSYSTMAPLASMCCNRELAIRHYRLRLDTVKKRNLPNSRDPRWARIWGYEPGTKSKRRGALTNEESVYRRSPFPNIDIRHTRNFSMAHSYYDEFRNPPSDWFVRGLDDIEGWNLRELFGL